VFEDGDHGHEPSSREVDVIEGFTGFVKKALELESSVPKCRSESVVVLRGKRRQKVVRWRRTSRARETPLNSHAGNLLRISEEAVASTKLYPKRARQVARL
jgi:hypothetical protein